MRYGLLQKWAAASGLALLSSQAAQGYTSPELAGVSPADRNGVSSLTNISEQQALADEKNGRKLRAALYRFGFITDIPGTDGGVSRQMINPYAFQTLSKGDKRAFVNILSGGDQAVSKLPDADVLNVISYFIDAWRQPDNALLTLANTLLTKEKLTTVDIAKIQISLKANGFETGPVTGALDKRTAEGLQKFFQEFHKEADSASAAVIKGMSKHLSPDAVNILFEDNEEFTPIASAEAKSLPRKTPEGYVLLDPELIVAMDMDVDIRGRVDFTRTRAREKGLDPNQMANQFWEESKFKPNAVSWTKCCKGIAQFSKDTGKDYGLLTDEDFFNPEKSMSAGIDYMVDLTALYRTQSLATGGYNGGPKPIEWAARETKLGDNLTAESFVKFMQSKLKKDKKGRVVSSVNSYARQTGGYVQKIDSAFWPVSKLERAHRHYINMKAPAVAWEGDAPKENSASPEEPKLCTLEPQLAGDKEMIEKRKESLASVPRPQGQLTAEDAAQMAALVEQEAQLEKDKCTPASNSARFFDEAARGYSIKGRSEKTMVTPARPPSGSRPVPSII